jgi:hypothetical protein
MDRRGWALVARNSKSRVWIFFNIAAIFTGEYPLAFSFDLPSSNSLKGSDPFCSKKDPTLSKPDTGVVFYNSNKRLRK